MTGLGYDRPAAETAVLIELALDRMVEAIDLRKFEDAISIIGELRALTGEITDSSALCARDAAQQAADKLLYLQEKMALQLRAERSAEKGRPAYVRTQVMVR
ncbi:hypothetical protein QQG91_02345 [Marivivens sp. LCG002]|uniref:hypothetical protein n=1 Tax=Marivivens sp. LCG002 TaxID=3051171 RepID=UPI00255335EC|nr:hypothetical protein [Marivivens sp. LCG002]WIV51304.1 hypothetical protein QQG91_02345 [Marivivens sp. LCG002]